MKFSIICPWCRYEHNGLDYIEPNDMEGEFVMDCEKCEKQFAVEFESIITFKTKRSE